MILVAGASGFVGHALLPPLVERHPGEVRALVRREFDAVRLRDQGVETFTGDLIDGRGIDPAMRGVDTLVYLVQTLDHAGDVVSNDLTAVQNTLLAARAAGVGRVVFLGSVGASERATSEHFVARWAAELAIRQSQLHWVILRAPLIVGDGATLFDMMRRYVNRSPVVPLFRWRRVEVEPVAIRDVVEAVCMAVEGERFDDRVFDICGSQRITFGEVVRGWGRAAGKRRIYLPLPGWGDRLLEQAAWSLARLPRRETRLLLATLRERQVCTDPSRRFPLPQRPVTYEQALEAVLAPGRAAPRREA